MSNDTSPHGGEGEGGGGEGGGGEGGGGEGGLGGGLGNGQAQARDTFQLPLLHQIEPLCVHEGMHVASHVMPSPKPLHPAYEDASTDPACPPKAVAMSP